MAATQIDLNSLVVFYWGLLVFGVALALLGWVMHRYETRLMNWAARLDQELAEAARLALQLRECEALGDVEMERVRAIAAAELVKVGRVRRFAALGDPLRSVGSGQ